LDTSIISYFHADDVPKEQQITRDFLEELIKNSNYEVYTSTVVLEEIKQGYRNIQILSPLEGL
jgi:predicted nucleic acid-binding protein